MPRAPKTRFLIASGARARFVERAPGASDLVTVGEVTPSAQHHHSHGPAHVSFESAANMRHGAPDRSDADRRRDDFARQLAEMANQQAVDGVYERLALVAPPRLLKALREHLSDFARSKVCFEVAKDLTKQPNHALREWLHAPQIL
ncbi:MAG TPA: host attachment protein [Caulobacteraceae bacterium]|nr:host attachment protein [Caulobacteraceae bacterium]